MTLPQKDRFLKDCAAALDATYDALAEAGDLELSSLDPASSALVVVDMVKGFAQTGPMSSPRVGAIIAPIARLVERCRAAGMATLAFADTHEPDSLELDAYPPHCLRGTEEAALCDEIAAAGERALPGAFSIVEKNSTNGAVEPVFDVWRRDNDGVDTLLVVGDCTDICVLQFVLTAKAAANARNRPLRLLVPLALVETFDSPGHDAGLMNAMALQLMRAAGAELYRDVV